MSSSTSGSMSENLAISTLSSCWRASSSPRRAILLARSSESSRPTARSCSRFSSSSRLRLRPVICVVSASFLFWRCKSGGGSRSRSHGEMLVRLLARMLDSEWQPRTATRTWLGNDQKKFWLPILSVHTRSSFTRLCTTSLTLCDTMPLAVGSAFSSCLRMKTLFYKSASE